MSIKASITGVTMQSKGFSTFITVPGEAFEPLVSIETLDEKEHPIVKAIHEHVQNGEWKIILELQVME